MWRFIKKHAPLVRALTVVSAVGVLVTGVTFAALQSQQAVLAGNSIQTATAGLLIGTDSATSTAFGSSQPGFTFSDLVPGGPAVPANGDSFYLKNSGTATLVLTLSVGSVPVNTADVDLSKVSVTITRTDTGTAQTATLASLVDGYPSGGLSLTDSLAPGTSGTEYKISVSMDADAFTGSSATIGSIDFVFSGTAAA